MRFRTALAVALLAGTPHLLHAEVEISLRGSAAAMVEQNRIAKETGLEVYRTPAEIRTAVDRGDLVPLSGDNNYEVADFVSFPYVNPTVALFVERVSLQYREACGQKLVVTSGTRPTNQQPANSHALSVHPMGMAVDLRVSDRASCRSWLEETLLSLEKKKLLNATREYRPPHYHLAIFPTEYQAYADSLIAEEMVLAAAEEAAALAQLASNAAPLVAVTAGAEAASSPTDSRSTGLYAAIATALVLVGAGARRVYTVTRR